jgi:hypothetical protein
MGIYSNGKVYGIRWLIHKSDETTIEFEKIYTHEMTAQNIREAKEEFDQLTEEEILEASFYFY